MKTTIKEIYSYDLCQSGFETLVNNTFNKSFKDESIEKIMSTLSEEDQNKDITILEVLESNGVEDAFWALRTQDYKDYCLIIADVAESTIDIYEKKYPKHKAPRLAIEAIRKYNNGEIDIEELRKARLAALVNAALVNAAYVVASADAAYEIAFASADPDADAYEIASASADTFASAVAYEIGFGSAVAYEIAFGSAAAVAAGARKKQWSVIEAILMKHLEEG